MNIQDRLNKFQKDTWIPLQQAVEKINLKKSEAIDFDFLIDMYSDEDYHSICEQQIWMIQEELKSLLSVKDNLSERMLLKAIDEMDVAKKESDDTRIARKILNKKTIIDAMLNSNYRFNPVAELNPHLYVNESYPLLFKVDRRFRNINADFIEVVTYGKGRLIKDIRIKRWFENQIKLEEDMIVDVDLRQYSFYIRREIQHANWTSLTG